MSEEPQRGMSWLRNPFAGFFVELLLHGVFVGLVALASILAAWIFGFEKWSDKAQVLGMAIVSLLMVVALVIGALFWARRKPEPPTGAKPASPEPSR